MISIMDHTSPFFGFEKRAFGVLHGARELASPQDALANRFDEGGGLESFRKAEAGISRLAPRPRRAGGI